MTTAANVAFGAIAILLGVLWVARPVRMSKLQQKYLFFGAGGDEVQVNETIARVAGVVLALAGAYLLVA